MLNFIVRKQPKEGSSLGWSPVTVSTPTLNKLREISKETGVSVCSLAKKGIEYALANMVILDGDQVEE